MHPTSSSPHRPQPRPAPAAAGHWWDAEELEIERRRAAIRLACPDVPAMDVRRLGQGWDSEVWEVDGRLVFRFPKRDDVVPWLEREIALLPMLAPRLPAAIPCFRYVCRDPHAWPRPFVGYPELPGQQLDATALVDPTGGSLADQLGAFLAALHAVPTEQALLVGVPRHDPAGWVGAHALLWRQVQAYVLPLLGALEQRIARRSFEHLLTLLGRARFAPGLVHGDLNGEHTLVDTRTSRLLGVIDFGDMRLADPALDFGQFPPQFAARMVHAYGAVDADFLERARAYGRLEPYRGVLFGLDTGDRALIRTSLGAVRAQLRHR
jgi:aminoglycoside phosphotransferase (APT) family kinase protein